MAAVPLRTLAALVGCFRVHTGVHYSADVLAGALTGTTVAELTTYTLDRVGLTALPRRAWD